MTKIRVSKGVREVEGSIREAVVKPFGTSGHIVVSRKDIGKLVSVITPDDGEMGWVLSDEEKKEVIARSKEAMKKKDDKIKRYVAEAIENFEKKEFSTGDFLKIIGLLEQNPEKNKELLQKIESVYDLKN